MIAFWDAAIVLHSQVSSFTLGWLFFMKQLFNDYEIHQSIIEIAFSVTFSFSCAMFELIIFEILDVLSTEIIITEVFDELQFNFYDRWFDVIFLISALRSILFTYLAHKKTPIN